MSKGTIIYIGGFELPDKNAAAHRVLSNAKILRKLGYEVVLISVDKNLPYDASVLNTRELIQGFEAWFVPYPRTNRHWLDYLTNIQAFTEVTANYSDIKAIICYNHQAVALSKIRNYGRKRNIKIFADCTEWYGTEGANLMYKILKGLDTSWRMRVIQKRLDGLIVISRYLEEYYSKCKNVIRIPPLVDLSEEKWKQDVPENRDEKIRLVYAGSPGQHKDKLNLIIDALFGLSDFNNYVFNIVGITKNQYMSDYKEQAYMVEKLVDRLVFVGRISHGESLQYVKMSDFSIFIRENTRVNNAGFPTKFVESISCGVPVITNQTSNLADYLIEGRNGFWIEEDLSATLQKILSKNKHEIYALKSKMKCDVFDYRSYLDEFASLLVT